jgi:hypothetical protein
MGRDYSRLQLTACHYTYPFPLPILSVVVKSWSRELDTEQCGRVLSIAPSAVCLSVWWKWKRQQAVSQGFGYLWCLLLNKFWILKCRNKLFASLAASIKQTVNNEEILLCTVSLTITLASTYSIKNRLSSRTLGPNDHRSEHTQGTTSATNGKIPRAK